MEWNFVLLEKKKGRINWNAIGVAMLENIYKKNRNLYNNYKIFNGLDSLYPVNWNHCVKNYITQPYENYKTIIRDYQPLIVLVNSVYKKLENMSEKEILEGKMPINYFINKSLEYTEKVDE